MGKHRVKKGLTVQREPRGRLARVPEEPAPAKLRRLYLAALHDMADARWASELGRLYRNGRITEVQFLAGERWGETVRRYRQAINAPALKSPSYERATPGAQVSSLLADERAITTMMHAAAQLSQHTLTVVRAVCEGDECATYELPALIAGLDALAQHWGLSGRRRGGKLARGR